MSWTSDLRMEDIWSEALPSLGQQFSVTQKRALCGPGWLSIRPQTLTPAGNEEAYLPPE